MKVEKCGIYRITHTNSGRFYLGSSTRIRLRWKQHRKHLRGGTHHCVFLQRIFDKYGLDALKFTIVEECSAALLRSREQQMLDIWRGSKLLLNCSASAGGGDLLSDHPKRNDIISRMTASVKARYAGMTAAERKRKHGSPGVRNGMFGRTHSPEARARIAAANKGKPGGMLGRKLSMERRQAISKAAKLRTGAKNSFFGRKHSAETKAKWSADKRGILPPNTKRTSVDDVVYVSLSAAARALGVCMALVQYRIKSAKYPAYFYVNENK